MKGDILIRIEGLMLERLIQRAMNQGACFASLRYIDERTLIVEANPSSARVLLNLCEKFSIPARVINQRGKAALFHKLRGRLTLLAGIGACIALCTIFFSRIWLIDIAFTGEEASRGDQAVFQNALAEMDIHPGTSRNLDTSLLSQTLEAMADGYSFVGVRIQGVRLLIEASPEVPAPEVYDVEDARDLYALQDGIVVSVNVQSGEACVKPGDTIRRGQLLIRGEERVTQEETRNIGALGEVIIRTWYTGEAEAALYESQIQYTGRSASASQLHLMGFSLPLTEGENYETQTVETEYLPVGGLFLPLEIVRETRRETLETQVERDREQLAGQLATLSMADAAATLNMEGPSDYEIAQSWINFDQPDSRTLRASAVYEIYTNTAVTRDVLLQGG